MTINKDTVQGSWKHIKGEIQKTWGRLNNDELEETKGDLNSVKGLIQKRYGELKEDQQSKLHEIFTKAKEKKEEVVETIKEQLKN